MASQGRRAAEGTAKSVLGTNGKYQGEFKIQKDAPFLKHRLNLWDELYKKHQDRIAKEPRKAIKIQLPDGQTKDGKSFETTPLDIATGISKGLADSVVVARVIYTEQVASLKAVANADREDDDEEEGQAAVLWDLTRPLEGSCRIELLKFDHPQGQEVFWHSSAHILGECIEQEYGVHLTVGPALETGFYYDGYFGSKKIAESDYAVIEKRAMEFCKDKQPFERCVLTKEEALELFKMNPFKVQLITNKVPDGALTSCYRCGPLIDLCRGPHISDTGKCKAFMVTKNSSAYWLGDQNLDSLQRIYGIAFPSDKLLKEYKKFQEEAAKRDHRNLGKQQELFMFHPIASPGSCFWFPQGARIYNKLIELMRSEYKIRGFQEVVSPNMYNAKLFMTSGHYQNYKDDMYNMDIEGEEWMLKPMNCPGHCLIFDHRVRSYKELPLRMADFGVLHRNEASGALTGLTRVRRFQQDDAHIFCMSSQIKDEVKSAIEFLQWTYKMFGFTATYALSTRPKKAIGSKEIWDNAEEQLKAALNESGLEWSLNPGDGAFYGPKIDVRLTDAMKRKFQCGTIQLDFNNPIRFNLQYKKEGAEEHEEDEEEKKEASSKEKKDKKASGGSAAPPTGASLEITKLGNEVRQVKEKLKGQGLDGKAINEHPEVKALVAKLQELKAKASDAPAPAKAVEAAPEKEEKVEKEDDFKGAVEKNEKGEIIWREGRLKEGFERPVMIHRAILGSVERMSAILMEHYNGKWPFWLSPRQIMVVPVSPKFNDYAHWVSRQLELHGYYAEAETSGKTLNKKVRESQVAQYNYILVVGESEMNDLAVNVRHRDVEKPLGVFTMPDLITKFKSEGMPTSKPLNAFEPFQGRLPELPEAAPSPSASGKARAKPKPMLKKGASNLSLRKPAAFGNLEIDEDGCLENFLEHHPYVKGFQPTSHDAELYQHYLESAPPETPNMRRWFDHMENFSVLERERFPSA